MALLVSSAVCVCVYDFVRVRVCLCLSIQSEDDFLDESDFDDISVHSATVLSDTVATAAAAAKKKARRGRKKRKSTSLNSLTGKL